MNTIRDLIEQYEGMATARIVHTAIGFELFAHKDSRHNGSLWVISAVYPGGESVFVNGNIVQNSEVVHLAIDLAIDDMRRTIADAIDAEREP